MTGIYALNDNRICVLAGKRLRSERLKQNITQDALARSSGISLSSVKKIEKGEIGSFDSFVRVLRVLGKLDCLTPLIEEDEMSPNEYYEFMNSLKKHQRRRATSSEKKTSEEISEW